MAGSEGLSRAIVHYSTAFLIWLFSLFVLIPLSDEVSIEPPLRSVIAATSLVAVSYLALAGTRAYLEWVGWLTELVEAKGGREKAGVYSLVFTEIGILVDSILLVPLVWSVSRPLGGMALIAAVAMIVLVLLPHSSTIAEYLARELLE